MNATVEKKPEARITEKQIQERLKKFDWESHWNRVIARVSREAETFERARAASRARSARKVFV